MRLYRMKQKGSPDDYVIIEDDEVIVELLERKVNNFDPIVKKLLGITEDYIEYELVISDLQPNIPEWS